MKTFNARDSSFIMNTFCRRQKVAVHHDEAEQQKKTLHERRRKKNKTAIEFLMRKYTFLQGILILKRVCM